MVQCTCSALCLECRGFESHPRQLIFLRKSDCLVNILYYMPASVVFEFLEYMPAPVRFLIYNVALLVVFLEHCLLSAFGYIYCNCSPTAPVLKAWHPGVPSYNYNYVCLFGLWLGGLLHLSDFLKLVCYAHVRISMW